MVPPAEHRGVAGAAADDNLSFLLEFLVQGKFYSLFSFLFGVGFAVFIQRASSRGADGVRLYKRRLVGLILIALVHTLLIWYGDILLVYAVLGFGLILFTRRDDRTVLRWTAGILVAPIVLYGLMLAVTAITQAPAPPPAESGGLPPILASAIDGLRHGGYPDIVRANVIFTVGNVIRRLMLMFYPRVFGMLLLGFYAQRRGIFRDLGAHRELLTKRLLIGLPRAAVGASMGDSGAPQRPTPAGLLETTVESIATPALSQARCGSASRGSGPPSGCGGRSHTAGASRCCDDVGRGPSSHPQVAHAGVAVGFAQLLIRAFHDERVMEEYRRPIASEEARDADLPAGRGQQIDAADHEVNPLTPVVHRHRKLIGPVAMTIAQQNVARLLRRILTLHAEPRVLECLRARLDAQPPPIAVDEREIPLAAVPRVMKLSRFGSITRRRRCEQRPPRAVAGIDETLRSKDLERVAIDALAVALSAIARPGAKGISGADIGPVAQPVEVIQDARLVLAPRSLAIVVLDPQQHLAAMFTRGAPHALSVQNVTEMEPPGGGGGKPCAHSDGNLTRRTRRARSSRR
jgi:hypothetical protein